MYKEKSNLLPRRFSGGLMEEVTFDLTHKGKVRALDPSKGLRLELGTRNCFYQVLNCRALGNFRGYLSK